MKKLKKDNSFSFSDLLQNTNHEKVLRRSVEVLKPFSWILEGFLPGNKIKEISENNQSYGVFNKRVVLKTSQNSQESKILFQWRERPCTYNFIKKETATQMFSCQSCRGFIEHLQGTASVFLMGNLPKRQFFISFLNNEYKHIIHPTTIVNLVPSVFLHYKKKTKKKTGTRLHDC